MELDKIIEIISDVLDIPKEEITADSKFQDDLGADSLDVVEIVMRLEDEFKLEVPDDVIEKIVTVGDAAEQIKKAPREQ